MTAPHDGIGIGRNLVDERSEIRRAGVIPLEKHDLQPFGFGVFFQFGHNVGRELVLFVDNGEFPGARHALQEQINSAGQITTGGSVGLIHQRISLLVGGIRGRAGSNHDLVFQLGDHGGGIRETAAVWADQKIGFVLADELRVKLLDPALVALVIVILHSNPRRCSVRERDPARCVHTLGPKRHAVDLAGSLHIQAPGPGRCESDHNRSGFRPRSTGHPHEHGGKKKRRPC